MKRILITFSILCILLSISIVNATEYTVDELEQKIIDYSNDIKSFNRVHRSKYDKNILYTSSNGALLLRSSAIVLLDEVERDLQKFGYKDKIVDLTSEVNNFSESDKDRLITLLKGYGLVDEEKVDVPSGTNTSSAPSSGPSGTIIPTIDELLGLANEILNINTNMTKEEIIKSIDKASELPIDCLKNVDGNLVIDEKTVLEKLDEVNKMYTNISNELKAQNKEDIISDIQKKITVQIPKDSKEKSIQIPKAAVDRAKTDGISFELLADSISMTIPPDFSSMANNNLKITIEKVKGENYLPDSEQKLQSIGDIYELKLASMAGAISENISSFDNKITLSFDIPKTIQDTKKLGIYYLNEKENKWQYVGGRVNIENGKIIASTSHFSKYAVMEYKRQFSDIDSSWAKSIIEEMAAKHVIDERCDSLFEPKKATTRADFAVWIAKALNLEDNIANTKFLDVDESDWYYKDVCLVNKLGIVLGSDGKFYPDRTITRQEMAVMIARALKYLKLDTNMETADIDKSLLNFADNKGIASWAKEGAALSFKRGIIGGREGKKFAPLETAQRAEAITMLKRLLDIQ